MDNRGLTAALQAMLSLLAILGTASTTQASQSTGSVEPWNQDGFDSAHDDTHDDTHAHDGTSGPGVVPGHAAPTAPQPVGQRVDVAWSPNALSASLPPQFIDEEIAGGWNQAIGATYADDGRLFVWEKAGRVWIVENDIKAATPFIDISEEVALWGDHGLTGFALDPNFLVNGRVYLLYAVDYHHLAHFGTPSYDPLASEINRDTMGRVTRYTGNGFDNFATADMASRQILLGDAIGNGIPLCFVSHSAGALQFGTDGSLLISTGDGFGPSFTWTCVTDGILTIEENVEQYVAQIVDSLSGKILRIDPATGDGYASNPFYDGGAPRAARSRVWALGLRNPFRFSVRPGSGSLDPATGDPGVLIVSDVGDKDWEEVNVVKTGGTNLGWPFFEGLVAHPKGLLPFTNFFAPNPLFGTTPAGQGPCGQEFFEFQDLFVQDSLNPGSWPNPCDPGQQVPTSAPVFMHTRPVISYGHNVAGGGRTFVPIYDGFGEAEAVGINAAGSPVVGDVFSGNAALAGTWYMGNQFPPEWRDGFYSYDYQAGWIRFLKFDGSSDLVSVDLFSASAGHIVAMTSSAVVDGLVYVNFDDGGLSTVRRIRYDENDLPPTAAGVAEPVFGPSLLTVAFDAGASEDPEGLELAYAWDFGDGTPVSIDPTPVHRFPSRDVTIFGTVVTRLDELSPPVPMGIGNQSPLVMRDGVYPPLGSNDWLTQFDTYHYDGVDINNVDKNGVDYIGYTFVTQRTLIGMVWQEGPNNDGLGGYFDDLHVQVRVGGVWGDVTGLVIDPPYPGDLDVSFEHFRIRFDPVLANGVRLWGDPGGVFEYVGAAELRVLGVGPVGSPTAHDVTVTVTDAAANEESALLTVFTDNTPPLVEILSPVQGSSFPTVLAPPIQLQAAVFDVEHGPLELSYAWQVFLHHNEHTHPGPVINEISPVISPAHDACDGDLHWMRIKLTVTDGLGLSTTRETLLTPDCDCDMTGGPDGVEIASDPSLDGNNDDIPDACQADCNGNGLSDAFEVHFKLTSDRNGNGIPDACDPHVTRRPETTTPEVLDPPGGTAPGGETTTAGGASSGH